MIFIHDLWSVTCTAESDPATAGKKTARKTTLAGGERIELEKVAQEQQMKLRQQMEESLASVRAKQEGQLGVTLPTCERDGEVNTVSGTRQSSGTLQSSVATSAKHTQGQPTVHEPTHKKHERSDPGKVSLCPTTHFHMN